MDPSTASSARGAASGVTAFLYLGFMGILGFSGLHLLFCLITSWVMGHDFSTVVYVTAATITCGTMITFTFAFLVLINVVITAFSNFSQFGQSFMGGGGGPPPNRIPNSNPTPGNPQPPSSFFDSTIEEEYEDERHDIKLD